MSAGKEFQMDGAATEKVQPHPSGTLSC